MLKRLFKPAPLQIAGEALYAATVTQARTPALYADMAVPDTTGGRFEIYSLHVYLLLARLKDQGEAAAELAQALFDTYLSALDNALRESGVGDLSVGKRMRKLGEAFYGRIRGYERCLAELPDTTELQALLTRTTYAGDDHGQAPALAAYILARRETLAAQPLERLLAGDVTW